MQDRLFPEGGRVRRDAVGHLMQAHESNESRRFLRQIEKMSRQVRPNRFPADDLEGFLAFQEELAVLQREIQTSISDFKRRAKTDRRLVPQLEGLRVARWHSRRLGDALAWIVLLYERKAIVALSDNAPVPISPSEDDGSRGVSRVMQEMLRQGWGLPIMHDITDCLRIGDISVLSFGKGGPTDRQWRTFEVKTSRTSTTKNDDGTETLHLNVRLITTEPMPAIRESIEASAARREAAERLPVAKRDDRRLEKQVERMRDAHAFRTLEAGIIGQHQGHPHINVMSDLADEHHWVELRRAIREARRTGSSYFTVDGFVGYSLFYHPDGVATEHMEKSTDSLHQIVKTLFSDVPGDRNSLTILSFPAGEDSSTTVRLLPFYLFHIPHRAIADILHGRLVIVGFLNSGAVERALTEKGFTVKPTESSSDNRVFEVSKNVTWHSGEKVVIEIPSPWPEMLEALQEVKGLGGILAKMAAVVNIADEYPFEHFMAQGQPRASEENEPPDSV